MRLRTAGFIGWLVLTPGWSWAGPAVATQGGAERALAREIPRLMSAWRVPGVAAALIDKGEVVWTRGFGWADVDAHRPVTPDTLFQAASMSKPVAAWTAMTLVREGRLDADAPVGRMSSAWSLPASAFDANGVTIRRILSHTAGLSVPGYLGFPPDRQPQDLDASLRSADDSGGAALAIIAPPGQGWRYSGGGYTLLQRVIERSAGKCFADAAAQRVLQPLGMRDSHFGDSRPGDQRATPYDRRDQSLPVRRFTAQAAAGLWTSAADFARFVAATAPGPHGAVPGRSVLPPESLRAMLTPQPHSDNDMLFPGSTFGLGYALRELPPPHGMLAYHLGDNPPGWHGLFAVFPREGSGLVVLTNGEDGRDLRVGVLCAWLRSVGIRAAPSPCR
ncbi:MAG: serine hydrolase domain-containing protein [Methylotetracoccus sp.]